TSRPRHNPTRVRAPDRPQVARAPRWTNPPLPPRPCHRLFAVAELLFQSWRAKRAPPVKHHVHRPGSVRPAARPAAAVAPAPLLRGHGGGGTDGGVRESGPIL